MHTEMDAKFNQQRLKTKLFRRLLIFLQLRAFDNFIRHTHVFTRLLNTSSADSFIIVYWLTQHAKVVYKPQWLNMLYESLSIERLHSHLVLSHAMLNKLELAGIYTVLVMTYKPE